MPKKNKRQLRRGEIVFDPEARKDFLRGFSERKRQRRAYGLAMQKVKDRKAKLDQRAEEKMAVQEQIEEAEKQKEALLEGIIVEHEESIVHVPMDTTFKKSKETEEDFEKVETYQDVQTQSQWGGEVIVTTSTHFPGDSDDEKERVEEKKTKKSDMEQEYAGNVEKFLHELRGNMPGKRKKDHRQKHKGKYGAANMKGMASGGDLKIAKRALQRSQAKPMGGKSHSNKRKR